MHFSLWFVTIGALFIAMALLGGYVKRMPLSTSVLYLVVGFGLGTHGLGVLHVDPRASSGLLERLSEVAVIVSLFTAGLKLSASFDDRRWLLPLRLAFGSMLVTVGLLTLVGVTLLKLPLGAAVLLGAILAPTDPVLASDVQVAHAGDRDELRFALTGEAGLNDGAAFPFVMLGLGLLGLHPLGPYGAAWLLRDVVWAIAGGLAVGALVGGAVGRLVVHLRTQHKEAVGLDEFLTLGLIALSYGAAVWLRAYGFLAVFAAGLALRRVERAAAPDAAPDHLPAVAPDATAEAIATDARQGPAYMARAVLGFNEQLERVGELSLVLLIAGTLTREYVPRAALWFVPVLLFVVRPVSIALGAVGSRASPIQRAFMAWFGIRGIGSVYYLMYALQHGLPAPYARLFVGLTLCTVAASIVVHGVSVTPLMNRYARFGRFLRRQPAP